MNLSKLFSSVGLASMVAMTTIIASPKPQAASAELAPQNSIILANHGETLDAEIPTANSLNVSDIPHQTVWENFDNGISSVEVPQDDSGVETFHATAAKTVAQPLENRVFGQDTDGFKVVQQQEPEQKPAFSIRIKSPEEIFRSLSFYVLIGFVLLVLAIMFFVEVIKFIVWIILLPLKILLSLFR
jgi:hypothetical protein